MRIIETLFWSALCAAAWMACGDAAESQTLIEANKIHEQITRLSSELHDAVMEEAAAIEIEMEEAMLNGDSALAMQLARIESRMDEWDVRFHDWNATVVEVPGMEQAHDHSDHAGHDHGDHAGHDHGDQHSGLSLEGMSDAEILAIQEALLAELEALRVSFEESIAAKPAIQE
jgi:hypothetical protein